MTASTPQPASDRPASGRWIVGGMVGLAVALALFAVGYQRAQTRRCLAFYGSDVARRIQEAPRVELWSLGADGLQPAGRTDISAARGLVHLRRGLVEDANFAWDRAPSAAAAPALALAFFDHAGDADPATLLLLAVDEHGGSLSVAGREGTVALGRIHAGLQKWLADVVDERQ